MTYRSDLATPMKSITLNDVAKAAGVSLITASRALSNPDRVSKETAKHVQAVAASAGYVPNLLAGGLRARRSHTVAALVPAISVSQFLPTVTTLTAELEQAGYQLILGQTGYDRARETALLNTMIGRRVDGIIVAGLLGPDAANKALRRSGIPVVETWDLTPHPFDMVVGFSHLKVGSAVAGFFLRKGWRKVGIATGDDQRAAVRREGFLDVMGRCVPTAIVPAPSSVASGRRALAELLAQEPALEAVFCSADTLAEGVLTEARARGLRVPEDLAVCGFGGAEFCAHLLPSLTTVQVDGVEIGRVAIELLLSQINAEPLESRVRDIGFQIVERASTHTA